VKSADIRETYLSFFEERGHLRRPSASLVPASHDPSVLLTTAGMQPLKPYFMGLEKPPAGRLTSAQRCFRTTDIEEVGNTARHLTFFEMLGNFSIGAYFKQEAIGFGWELSLQGFGFNPEEVWVTVFAGDEELGLGPDTEAIEIWRSVGVPEERIVRLPRSENFWQAGPTGPCGPCSEMYLDRGESFGGPEERPGDDTDRFLEYWNHVFMTYELHGDGSLTDLPAKNIDTGMGLERMAAILQDAPSVFETDLFRPLIDLAVELSGRDYDADPKTTRAMRIVADHVRGSVELIADGVVPSNEDRGYILRRIMRRAIQQGRVLGLEAPWLGRFAERVIEMLGDVHPEVGAERETVMRWVQGEEESFGRTLERGTELLSRLLAEAEEAGTSWIAAEDAFQLHDTYGFPYEMTKELVAEQGLSVDDSGFEALMDRQRQRARGGGASVMADRHDAVISFVGAAPRTRFVGYAELDARTSVAAAAPVTDEPGQALVKLEESPFYPEGGGQVADSGTLRWNGSEAGVLDVYRVGDDQALRIAGRPPEPGERVEAEVDHLTRHATMRNHTATHLLHAALRERLGTHVRQAGSAVRPDKLRFDFTHGARLSRDELTEIEDRVNEWIKQSRPVRALEMARSEAERLGAMALFGEKYGDWVRMVEVDGISRELCGGTHVANTAEVGIFAIAAEGSSAANVRRIEALTGPAAIDFYRERRATLEETGNLLGSREDPLGGARRNLKRLDELERQAKQQGAEAAGGRADELADAAEDVDGVAIVVGGVGEISDQKAMLDLADQIRQRLGNAAVVLGGSAGGKVALVGAFSEPVTERGLSAAEIVRKAAAIVGGGGGGRADVAQAGGRDATRLEEALEAAGAAIRDELDSGSG
jgi:alanyl-tRNA synthetase